MPKKNWIHPVKADARYSQVKQLVAEGKEVEAQKLEETIWADVRAAGYELYSFGRKKNQ